VHETLGEAVAALPRGIKREVAPGAAAAQVTWQALVGWSLKRCMMCDALPALGAQSPVCCT